MSPRFAVPLALCLCVALAGCTVGGAGTAPAARTLSICMADTQEGETNVLNYAYSGIREAAGKYQSARPGVTIVFETYAAHLGTEDEDERHQAANRLLERAGAGEIDLIIAVPLECKTKTLIPDVELLMRDGFFSALDGPLADAGVEMDDYSAPVLGAGQMNGKQWVMPLSYEVYGFLCSAEQKEALGLDVPGGNAFSQIEAIAGKLPPAKAATALAMVDPFLLGSSPVLDYRSNIGRFDNALLRATLSAYTAAASAPDEADWYESVEGRLLPEGFYRCGGLASQLVGLAEQMATVGRSTEFVPMLNAAGGITAEITSWAGIPANGRNQQLAADFLAFLLGAENQSGWTGGADDGHRNDGHSNFGYIPVRSGTMENWMESWRQAPRYDVQDALFLEMLSAMTGQKRSLSHTRLDGSSAGSFLRAAAVDDARFNAALTPSMRETLNACYGGSISVDDAIAQLDAQVLDHLRE